MLAIDVTEKQVVELWQQLLTRGTEFITESGEPIKIIYPGRSNDDRGADFRDAIMATRKGLVRGDVEVHAKSSDWQAHRHHRDQAYKQVILQVVMWHNATASLLNGGDIPVLALEKYLKEPYNRKPDRAPPGFRGLPCCQAHERLSEKAIARFLDQAGEERFFTKATRFQSELAEIEAGQCLYQGIMEALGYAKNKIPFLELAHRLPLKVLESIVRSEMPEEECLVRLQALLLGTAGLLSCQCQIRLGCNDVWIARIERLWAVSGNTQAMSPDAWYFFKVRPNNSPIRRLVALSHLIVRYKRGLLAELLEEVRTVPLDKGCRRLESALRVSSNQKGTLLGSRRAADIVVNVLLPFSFAWGKVTPQQELAEKALALYRHYPGLIANAVERHMTKQLGLNNGLVNSARRQQGLLHIYRTLCTQGRCECCHFNPA